MWEFILSLLELEPVQVGLSVVIVTIIGFLARQFWWARHVVGLGLEAYQYAEREGLLKGLRGHEKLKPFMDHFVEEFRKRFGRDPSAQDRAKAVEAMEKQVAREHSSAGALGGS
ncbi:MAG: hypothetical protein BAA04_01710 [Firmicutes bacterium ZCTH02-B6]|nr:MAG: hypothetical protein BAA04_01710 [Firmicutes bacterium ZCTH02-B6]